MMMEASKGNVSTVHSEVLSPSQEVRKLRLWARTKLIRLLDMEACWKKLASVILKPDGTYLFSVDDISAIEKKGYRTGGSPAQAFLEHWGTVGKPPLPTLKDLLQILTVAKLYRIKYFVHVDLLKGDPNSLSLVDDDTCYYSENISSVPTLTDDEFASLPEDRDITKISALVSKEHLGQISQQPDGLARCPTPQEQLKNNEKGLSVQEEGNNEDNLKHVTHFRYNFLAHITKNFNSHLFQNGGCLLGEGAFGVVYHGVSQNGQQWAIKRIKGKVDKQFMTEIEVLTKYRHPNLLPLLGYSCDGPAACLVYSFASKGSLQERLAEKNNAVLPWKIRLKISVETARGICHLHTFGKMPLVHRDIKSANVLLDDNMTAMVGDFGLVRVGNSGASTTVGVTQTVFGTPVYMAREAYRGDVSVKLDTFSYGVVLLELLTGLPPHDESREEMDLLSHVNEYDNIEELLDPFAGQWDNGVAVALYAISKLCTEEKKRSRPTMVEVLPKVEAILN